MHTVGFCLLTIQQYIDLECIGTILEDTRKLLEFALCLLSMIKASQVHKDFIMMFIKEEKRKRALFQLLPTPHSTDISLTSNGPCFFSAFFPIFFLRYFFILIRIIKRILKVSVHATLSQAPGYCIANFQASPESCKSFNKCL